MIFNIIPDRLDAFIREIAPDISRLNPGMSPFTGALFAMASLSLLMKMFRGKNHINLQISSLMGLLVTFSGFVATLGYVFGSPFLYGGATIPLAATTSAGFLALGCGLTHMTRNESLFLRPFVGPAAGAGLLRAILPLIITAILLQGIAGSVIASRFAVNQALLAALLTLVFILVTSVVGIRLSYQIFRAAGKAEIERLNAERELYRSKQVLQAIVDDIPQRIFCKDLESRYLWCNKSFADDAGLAAQHEIIGKNDFQLPWKKHAELYRTDDRAVMESGVPKLHYLEPLVMPDSEKRWLQTSKTPLRDPDGNIFGVLGSFEDITQRIAAEDELRSAKDQAEAANRAKDEFLSTISHELLTPLNGILGYSEIIGVIMPKKNFPNVDEIQNDLQTIHECGETLLGIINDVLELSRLEAGKFESVQNEFSPMNLIAATLAMFKFGTDNKHLELDFTHRNLPVMLVGDSLRLKQILFNLIGNAVKFTEKGKIEVCADWSNDKLIVSIIDTGIGIPPEKQKLILQPFVQADQSLSRKYSGAGLGLAVVSRMLKMLGGSIEFESEPGRGSVFTIEFPVKAKKA